MLEVMVWLLALRLLSFVKVLINPDGRNRIKSSASLIRVTRAQ
jgi:hypothetical protein